MKTDLKNLSVQEEPDYRIRIVRGISHTILRRSGREQWKRLSAICHARHFAIRNPDCQVYVERVLEPSL